jgi:hypothetical protein
MSRHRPWINRMVLAVLRSPAHRLLSGSVCELTYRAPSDGREVHLPVQYTTAGPDLIVLAGGAPGKRWWRAFVHPRAVTVRQAGRTWTGLACVIHPDHPTSRTVRDTYERDRHVRISTTDRIVLINPVAPEEKSCTSSPERRSALRS